MPNRESFGEERPADRDMRLEFTRERAEQPPVSVAEPTANEKHARELQLAWLRECAIYGWKDDPIHRHYWIMGRISGEFADVRRTYGDEK